MSTKPQRDNDLETNPDKRMDLLLHCRAVRSLGSAMRTALHTGGPEGNEEELSMDYAAWIRRCVRQATAWAQYGHQCRRTKTKWRLQL